MPTWYEAFGRWATTCKSVDGCNIGAEQKRHCHSFLTFVARCGPRIIEHEMGGIEREIMVILALTHSMQDLMILSTWVTITLTFAQVTCTCIA